MNIHSATLETCSITTDTVIVIDVWRAFTTTEFAFHACVLEIIQAGSKEALSLHQHFSDTLLMGRRGNWVDCQQRGSIMATHRRH